MRAPLHPLLFIMHGFCSTAATENIIAVPNIQMIPCHPGKAGVYRVISTKAPNWFIGKRKNV